MNFFSTISALAASGPLASRAFLPLFVVCLLARFPGITDAVGLPPLSAPQQLAFLTSNWFLLLTGALAALELFADKNSDARALLDEAHHFVKAGVAVLVALMVLPAESAALIPDGTMTAGIVGLSGAVALLVGALTFGLSWLRREAMQIFDHLDPHGELGIGTIISLLEDLWSVFGLLLCLVFPLLALALVAFLFAAVAAARQVMLALERRHAYPCVACKGIVMPAAVRCRHCRVELTPRRVLDWSVLSTFKHRSAATVAAPAADLVWTPAARDTHRHSLLARSRCPDCAEPVSGRHLLKRGCALCGLVDVSSDPLWFETYHANVMRRAWQLVPVLCALSLIPVVGLAVALVSMRIYVVSPLRVFTGFRQRFLARWGLRVVTVLLLLPASLPGFSVVAVPLLVLIHLWVYGRLARRSITAANVVRARTPLSPAVQTV